MRKLIAAAAAIAIFAPTVFAGVPGVEDVVREYDHAREIVTERTRVAHGEITTDIEDVEIGGVVRIEGTARVEEGFEIGAIRFYVDHLLVGHGGYEGQWAFDLDTRRLVDGPHEFRVSVTAVPLLAGVHVVGLSGGDAVGFRSLNHVVGVVLHEATYEGLDARTHLWDTVLDQDYVALKMTVTLHPDDAGAPVVGGPLVGEAVVAYREKGGDVEPTKTWVASFGLLKGGATVMSRPPHDLLKEGSTLALAGGFVGDGRITIRIEAVPWP